MKDTTTRKIFGADIEAPFFILDREVDLGLAPFSEQIMKRRIAGFTFDDALQYIKASRQDYNQVLDQIGSIFVWKEEDYYKEFHNLLDRWFADQLIKTGERTLDQAHRALSDQWVHEGMSVVAEEWAKKKGFPRKHSAL